MAKNKTGRHITTSLTRFAAIAVAAAGIVTGQSAAGGVLFTHTGGNNEWINNSAWTGGTGFPDQSTEDARLISSTSTSVRVNVSIGGIQGDAGSTLRIIRNGSAVGTFTLNGITAGGTTPFSASTLDYLFVQDDGIFVNTGTSNLTIDHLNVTESGRFRNFPNALGRVNFTGGTKLFAGNAEMDNYATLELRSLMIVRDNAIINNDNGGTYTLNGGTTNVFNGARLENVSLVEHNDGALTVHGGGTFDNTGDLWINGGTVQVDAGATLNGLGSTTLNGGTLRVNGEMVQTGFNGFVTGLTINGGTLAGSGTVRSDIDNIGGTVGPGNSPGTLTVDGNYTQGPGGTLAIEIESLLLFDVLDISGIADLGGILDLTVDAGYAAAAQDGDTFTIVEWDSFSGAFDTVNGLNFATDKFFTLDYTATGLTLTVNAETVVAASEPGVIALFGLGLAGIGFARRKRQRP